MLDPARVRIEEVVFASDGSAVDAYLARPAEEGPRAGIVVVHEIFGLVDHIRDVARRFANIGYDALSPDLYSRVGAPESLEVDVARAKAFSLDDAQVVRDLESAAGYLRGLDDATGKVGLIGFCSGGRYALLAACTSGAFDAAVDCWGGFLTRATPDEETTPTRPTRAIDLAGSLRCPLYAVFGENDSNPSPDVARELERRLPAEGPPGTVEVFAGAGHAFFADYRPTYVEAAAFELWPKVLRFFGTHLG